MNSDSNAADCVFSPSSVIIRCVKMREMQGAEAKVEGSLHEVNDRNRMPKATLQIAYFHAPYSSKYY